MATLSIDLGLKSYDVCDADGSAVGTIRFNPADPGLVARWKEAYTKVREMANGTFDTPEALAEMDRQIKAQVDRAFGTPVSAVLFRQVSSLAMCEDGSLVLEHVLDAVEPIITEAQRTAQTGAEERMRAHTARYEGSRAGLAPEQK